MLFDLAIVGAGPAGCSAAITAARYGAQVLLLERGSFPRQKVCGEFVSAESIQVLKELLGDNAATLLSRSPSISQGRIFVDGVTLRTKINPAAISIARFELDSALWNAAIRAGAVTHAGMTVRAIESDGLFRIVCIEHTFEAKAVVNAAGRWSNLASAATRARVNREKWLGIKAHFAEPAVSNSVDLYFFDGGYCGVQPVRAAENSSGIRINACAMVQAHVASTMPEVLGQHPGLRERSREWKSLTEVVTTSPLIFHEPEPVQGSMLQAGDAAMFVDPFIGDGISLALRSGVLAAECLVPFFRRELSLDQVRARYSDEYHARFAHVLNTSSRLRGMLRWPRAVRKPVLSVLAKAPLLTSGMVKMTR
ncbi:MAG TPA: NAD(P)/FAD-dependent oxidoreductase [Terriglobales bacterium]|nr:NAD(P)/FAD-dependent oxidoreductase [Terriglobales bacterium]